MKIYVEDRNNIIFKNLVSNTKIMHNIEKNLVNKQFINKIYSREGTYQINNNQTYNLRIISENVCKEKVTLNNKTYNLVIDKSKIEKNITFQIPYQHICIPLFIYNYAIDSNKHLKLVIENLYNDKNKELIPIDYYFEYNMENNKIPMEDINVFLSLLN
jgi:hypothetical protein